MKYGNILNQAPESALLVFWEARASYLLLLYVRGAWRQYQCARSQITTQTNALLLKGGARPCAAVAAGVAALCSPSPAIATKHITAPAPPPPPPRVAPSPPPALLRLRREVCLGKAARALGRHGKLILVAQLELARLVSCA